MKTFPRRTLLRYSGIAAASLALRRGPLTFAQPPSTPVAKTAYGSISGTLEDGINVFRGIPYGADTAPVRFQAPLPPTPWTGVKLCDAFTTRAPQLAAMRGPQALAAPSLG
ncbi:MAG: carboxylesterase family protein, partial [Terracidiphilus sp.]